MDIDHTVKLFITTQIFDDDTIAIRPIRSSFGMFKKVFVVKPVELRYNVLSLELDESIVYYMMSSWI